MKTLIRILFIVTSLTLQGYRMQAQVPILNSFPGAAAVIYLDFDGEYISGTGWNWSGPIDALPATVSTGGIIETFNRVAEDYRPFNVNITTDLQVFNNAPANQRMRVILTPTYAWYGWVGGIAFVNSFVWGDDTPCWVFSSLLGNDPKFLAEAVSHEAGHTLGLQHQSAYDSSCVKILEYSEGQGDGEIGWAPIMGVGYYKNFTTWNIGPNAVACNKIQNDISILAARLGLRTDDHSGITDSATIIPFYDINFHMNGLVNQSGDVDVFRVNIPLTGNLKLSAVPQNVGTANEGANIDMEVSLINETLDTIGRYNPSNQLNVEIDTTLNTGSYYIVVRGAGNINHSDYGSIGFYSLQGALLQVLPLRKFLLKGSISKGYHELTWSYEGNEKVSSIIVESSSGGRNFSPLVTIQSGSMKFTYKPMNVSTRYRLKAVMEGGEFVYSNMISLEEDIENPVQFMTRIVHDVITIHCAMPQQYVLYDAGGRILSKGRLEKGISHIAVRQAERGFLMIQLHNGKVTRTEKLIKQ